MNLLRWDSSEIPYASGFTSLHGQDLIKLSVHEDYEEVSANIYAPLYSIRMNTNWHTVIWVYRIVNEATKVVIK